MPAYDDPEFLEALQKVFATRADIRAIADYQQKLYTSLSELNSSHRTVHEHVRRLTESHTRSQNSTDTLERAREDLERLLRNLEQAHAQTQNDVRRATDDLYRIQQEIRKIPLLEERIARLERDLRDVQSAERYHNRKDNEQDRLKQLEQRR